MHPEEKSPVTEETVKNLAYILNKLLKGVSGESKVIYFDPTKIHSEPKTMTDLNKMLDLGKGANADIYVEMLTEWGILKKVTKDQIGSHYVKSTPIKYYIINIETLRNKGQALLDSLKFFNAVLKDKK